MLYVKRRLDVLIALGQLQSCSARPKRNGSVSDFSVVGQISFIEAHIHHLTGRRVKNRCCSLGPIAEFIAHVAVGDLLQHLAVLVQSLDIIVVDISVKPFVLLNCGQQ